MKYLKRLLILAILLSIFGCGTTPTIPNKISTAHQIEEVENLLSRIPYDIRMEILRLPEYQTVAGPRQIRALHRFTTLIKEDPDSAKSAINEWLSFGKPEVRQYATLLRFTLWLLEEDNPPLNPLQASYDIIMFYATHNLRLEHTHLDVLADYNQMMTALNDPRLTGYYQMTHFTYVFHDHCNGFAKRMFKIGTGCCACFTKFSVLSLAKGGYKARVIRVKSPTNKKYHNVCEYWNNGKKIMDNSYRIYGQQNGIFAAETYFTKLPFKGIGYW